MKAADSPLVCDLSQLTNAQRRRLIAVSTEVFGAADEVRELPNGFALAYGSASADLIEKIAEFIAYDRLCCAFLEHGLVIEADGGPTWLHVTGRDGAKQIIAADVLRLIPHDLKVSEQA